MHCYSVNIVQSESNLLNTDTWVAPQWSFIHLSCQAFVRKNNNCRERWCRLSQSIGTCKCLCGQSYKCCTISNYNTVVAMTGKWYASIVNSDHRAFIILSTDPFSKILHDCTFLLRIEIFNLQQPLSSYLIFLCFTIYLDFGCCSNEQP